ncbi:predicted protein [Nematostella vectensis]|uniref:Uncharacterized protein n=1 Tax=Nematostella vectensis TaxID=45351 RepID=A7S231_NEMVE|nr:predicted protein [Nematostella vectensis]|eukprot:XP_001634230.1 predicted protein [Nematostella vectensis]
MDGKHSTNDLQNKHDDLRDFVANECKEQIRDGSDSENGLDAERMNQFYQRAIAESERMNSEVNKSHIQRQKLYDELGSAMFAKWSEDHAAEVLTDEQYHLWSNEEKQSKELLQQIKGVALSEDGTGSDDASQ